ncbi:hypothetical protein EON66_07115 [archaeon]|nr:MAG: hypothetical protein EON66_07115 [archaeon]
MKRKSPEPLTLSQKTKMWAVEDTQTLAAFRAKLHKELEEHRAQEDKEFEERRVQRNKEFEERRVQRNKESQERIAETERYYAEVRAALNRRFEEWHDEHRYRAAIENTVSTVLAAALAISLISLVSPSFHASVDGIGARITSFLCSASKDDEDGALAWQLA